PYESVARDVALRSFLYGGAVCNLCAWGRRQSFGWVGGGKQHGRRDPAAPRGRLQPRLSYRPGASARLTVTWRRAGVRAFSGALVLTTASIVWIFLILG